MLIWAAFNRTTLIRMAFSKIILSRKTHQWYATHQNDIKENYTRQDNTQQNNTQQNNTQQNNTHHNDI